MPTGASSTRSLGREYERAQRFGQPVSLILLDIDDFKQINDTRGHLAGDAVLHGVAATLAEADPRDRPGGALRRRGVRDPPAADRRRRARRNLAERLRSEIASRPDPVRRRRDQGITASFGVAAGPEDAMTQIDLIASADAALYQAKRDGKNHVTVAEAW